MTRMVRPPTVGQTTGLVTLSPEREQCMALEVISDQLDYIANLMELALRDQGTIE